LTVDGRDRIVVVSERDRRILHQSLIAQIGEPEADSLMELLPRDGWEDLASKSDLQAVKSELQADLRVLRAELTAGFHRDMVRQTWIFAASSLTALGLLGGLLH